MADVTYTKSRRATKSNNSRQVWSGGKQKQGRGNDRLVVGRVKVGGKVRRHRGYVKFFVDSSTDFWDGVEEVLSAEITFYIARTGANTVITGTEGRMKVGRQTQNFKNATGGGWTNEDFTGYFLHNHPAVRYTRTVQGVGDGNEFKVPVTSILRQWAPKRVKFPGNVGVAKANNGFNLAASGNESAYKHAVEIYSANAATALQPLLTMTYKKINEPPSTQMVTPNGGVVNGSFDFSGTFVGPEATDTIHLAQVAVQEAGAHRWNSPILGVNLSTLDDLWHIAAPPTGLLKKGHAYTAIGYVWDNKGKRSVNPANLAFSILADPPTITPTPVGQHDYIDNVFFEAPFFVDPNAWPPVGADIQLQKLGGDWTDLLWNERIVVSLSERDAKKIYQDYRGSFLGAGQYEWRIRLWDLLGGDTGWQSDNTIDILIGTSPDEGEQEYTTGWNRRNVGQRIILYAMRPDRGPDRGHVLGIVENAANIGSSWYASAPGELYFTLPSDHEQVSVIEPMVTHYELQHYRQGKWKTLSEGLIRDFDADMNETIFYGMDYLGLLSWSIEAAKQPEEDAKKEMSPNPGILAGSRYVNKTVSFIIKDQLKRARLQDVNSPVKFIGVGRVAYLESKITIFASYAERLSFIRGLIDSHRGAVRDDGGERRSRVRVRWNPGANLGQGRHQFEVLDDSGRDRPNVRLEYGSVLQGYQVIPLDEFSSRIYAFGKEPNADRPWFTSVNSPGIDQTTWGSIAYPAFYNDVTDKKDLERRARTLGIQRSRVGKRMALGLRVAGLDPFDGWDILDAVPIVIEDGTVSTSAYGSGYWVIWGVEWRVFPDGHDEMTLIVRPRGDRATIDPDLIPSDPIHFKTDWKWGNGPPPEAT